MGNGISLTNKFKDVPMNSNVVVQKYLDNPFLVKQKKFDFRIFVLLPSVNPLRLYLHSEGTANFAVLPFSNGSYNRNE